MWSQAHMRGDHRPGRAPAPFPTDPLNYPPRIPQTKSFARPKSFRFMTFHLSCLSAVAGPPTG